MTVNLHEASSEVTRDLSPEWLDLSSRVRRLAAASSTPDGALAQEALRLCEHVERLHADVEQLLGSLRAGTDPLLGSLEARAYEPDVIDKANIEIQREMHQKSDLQHIIKALFMWKDDPVQRVRERAD
ncbi:MAG: hypothetical protein KF712_07645 [Akkermansiaceae bacterium]|nr:hypothetical protein [Akkermansiaceae bacterium]